VLSLVLAVEDIHTHKLGTNKQIREFKIIVALNRGLTCCHDCGFNCRWAPVRIEFLKKTNNSRNMRAGHRCARHGDKRNPAIIKIFICRACCSSVGSYDVHSRSSNIGLNIKKKTVA
jgi:hypothetical protein